MRLLCILAVYCLAVSASPSDQDETRVNGENGWYIPRGDGSYDWVDKDAAEATKKTLGRINKFGRSINTVTYYLYTRSNPHKEQQIEANIKSINASNFNPAHPTRFVIHGFTQSYHSSINKDIRNAWLSVDDYNVIFVDWARARTMDYFSSVAAIPEVGKKVASMIDFLVENYDMSLDTLHVIGHSLGAHVAGYAGKNVKTGKIHTIVGLDPAFPLFNYDKPEQRLASSDAVYVESIQTCGGKLGFLKPIGTRTFYPNGGKYQPGCTWDLFGKCAHARSIKYYAEAVAHNNFAAIKCGDYEQAVAGKCGSTYSSVRMGADTNAYMVAGEYYVPVNEESHFGVLS